MIYAIYMIYNALEASYALVEGLQAAPRPQVLVDCRLAHAVRCVVVPGWSAGALGSRIAQPRYQKDGSGCSPTIQWPGGSRGMIHIIHNSSKLGWL